MQVGRQAKVVSLDRPSPKDRTAFVEQEGMLIRRLNVAWEPELGALWEVRFSDGTVEVFAESELRQISAHGVQQGSEIPDLKHNWGEAPRTVSVPFKKFAGGSRAAPAVLAFLALSIAGILLIWSGIAQSSMLLGAAGVLLILIGMGAAAALVS